MRCGGKVDIPATMGICLKDTVLPHGIHVSSVRKLVLHWGAVSSRLMSIPIQTHNLIAIHFRTCRRN